MSKIDHIVYAVPNLQQGMDDFEKLSGVRPTYGGKHLHQGTHNALVNLGENIYFELLAIDPDNNNVPAPLWMGMNLITEPTITRFAIKSNDMERDCSILEKINPLLAETKTGMREKKDGTILNWRLSIPLASPKIEMIPFLLDWQDSQHPTESLKQNCSIIDFRLHHPAASTLKKQLIPFELGLEIMESDTIAFELKVKSPNGTLVLS